MAATGNETSKISQRVVEKQTDQRRGQWQGVAYLSAGSAERQPKLFSWIRHIIG